MARDIINRHRGLGPGELPRRYLRRDDRPHPDDVDADAELDVGDPYAYDDDYWHRNDGAPFDFLLHRLSTEVMWSVAPGPRLDVGEVAPVEATPIDDVAPDDLPDALFAHVERIVSLDELPRYLASAPARAAHAELSRAYAAHPGVVRWFAERAGPAFVLVLLAPFWIRRARAWSPPDTTDVDAIGRSLVLHLLVRYPVPEALLEPWRDTVWPVLKWTLWLVVLGQGASLRRAAARFGWTIEGTFVHHLRQAPPTLGAREAVVWAELHRLGGDDTDVRRLANAHAYALDPTMDGPVLDEGAPAAIGTAHLMQFWRATAMWLIRHRAQLTDPEAHAVLAWAMHRHTEDVAREVPPADRFAWRGRTPAAALVAATAYAATTARPYGRIPVAWRSRGWDWEGASPRGTWTVHELTTSALLADESAAMGHCVASYDYRCAQGMSAVFSLCLDGARQATVELAPTSRRVAQARGAHNRACTAEELQVIARWLAATAPAAPTA